MTISTVPRICTLVNVFTVDPQNQERLLETRLMPRKKMKNMPGLRLWLFTRTSMG